MLQDHIPEIIAGAGALLATVGYVRGKLTERQFLKILKYCKTPNGELLQLGASLKAGRARKLMRKFLPSGD